MQILSTIGARESVYFKVQSMEGLEIHLEKFKPTRAHLSVARLCVAGHRLVHCLRFF
jgi:hypothetical protein